MQDLKHRIRRAVLRPCRYCGQPSAVVALLLDASGRGLLAGQCLACFRRGGVNQRPEPGEPSWPSK
jgi:hypothetical protein